VTRAHPVYASRECNAGKLGSAFFHPSRLGGGRDLGPLHELRTYLESQEVNADPLQVGAAFLALARAQRWNEKPEDLIAWLEELALDVARNWRHAKGADAAQSGVDTVPIGELKKIAQALKRERAPRQIPGA
jgi:hypothetical protein